MDLASISSPEVRRHADRGGSRGPLVLVPVGSLEQHGPHLPLDTDTVIATAVATRAATRLGALVAPAVAFGSSGEHQSFPGTVSIGTEALSHLLVELVRSLRTWSGPVLLVNGHGGNLDALTHAVGLLQSQDHDVAWVPCRPPRRGRHSDLHAGRSETSLMLHLAPRNVEPARARRGDLRTLTEILPLLRDGGVAAVSPNGVLGDPSAATAVEGAELLEAMVDDVLTAAGAWA